jgi:hypothetical protein
MCATEGKTQIVMHHGRDVFRNKYNFFASKLPKQLFEHVFVANIRKVAPSGDIGATTQDVFSAPYQRRTTQYGTPMKSSLQGLYWF